MKELLGRPLNHYENRYAPERFFVSGALTIPFDSPRVAVVGTRHPSLEGVEFTRKLVSKLVQSNIIIVSGLAKGIDTAAHRAAIEYGGRTVAVLGTPLDKFYPPENQSLQQLIMKDHLAVSQFPLGHKTCRYDFIKRNRTMALISDASIIVEVREKSGALSQGWETIRLGRPLFIAPLVQEKGLKWSEKMMEYGAQSLKLKNLKEMLSMLPRYPSLKHDVLYTF
ncbi:MAG: DNA-processing protein DprA [Nitrososphaerota archaeon]|nr:DNA-protecting protein DprA [Candidatus Calditenuaceae archaeon]MDW8073966.1 DNA-processing protein DprA [Nitrososphaerota archaeon]